MPIGRACSPADCTSFSPLVTRLFDEHRIAGIEQHLGTQRQRLLRAGHYDHLLRRRLDAPLPLQVVRDLRAQLRQPLRIGIPQQPLAMLPQHLLLPLQPLVDGKRPQIRQRRRQRSLAAGVRRMADRQQRPAAVAQLALRQPRLLPRRRRQQFAAEQRVAAIAHKAAAPHRSADEPFRLQPSVGLFHRVARHRQPGRQHTARRQLRPPGQFSGGNQLQQGLMQRRTPGQALPALLRKGGQDRRVVRVSWGVAHGVFLLALGPTHYSTSFRSGGGSCAARRNPLK